MRELPKALNLGCGSKRRDDCVNVDHRAEVSPDLVWDLNRHPYPLPRGHFERVYAHDVVEHLESVPGFMDEVHALLAPGGVLELTTPHFSCANAYTDPTHLQRLGYFSFDFFSDPVAHEFSTAASFEIVERLLVFHHGLLNRVVARLANRFPEAYEQRYTWIFPAWFMIFRLRALSGRAADEA